MAGAGMTLDKFIYVENKLGIRRSIVLFTTLWMTYTAFDWAAVYAGGLAAVDAGAALIIAAVTAPITYLQKVVFDAYLEAKKS